MTRQKESTEYLRHTFSEAERLQMGSDLAATHNRLSAVDDEEAVVKSKFKERRATLQQSVSSLSRDLDAGWTMQDVECTLSYGVPNPLEITYYRKDTGEVVKTRAMNPEEMQEELPLGGIDGEIVVIPPEKAAASAEKSAENIAVFFDHDDGGELEQVLGEEAHPSAESPYSESNAFNGDAIEPASSKSGPKELAEPHKNELEIAAKPAVRKPRGFSKQTNESVVW
jgi:hypothetical protein